MRASQQFIDELGKSLEISLAAWRGEQAKKEKKLDVIWHPNCIVCGNENPAGMARVCSSKCYLEAPLTKAPAV